MEEDRISAGRSKCEGRSLNNEGIKQEDCYLSGKVAEEELPRRCLVIKRTHPEDGIERTELRLVTYQKIGHINDQAHVLMDAARYLQERADDAECSIPRRQGGRCRTSTNSNISINSNSSSGDVKNTSLISTTTTGETKCHCNFHQAGLQEQLRSSLKNLVTYFARRADESEHPEWSAITLMAQDLLQNVCDCIRKEKPLDRNLLGKIRRLYENAKDITLHSTSEATKTSTVRTYGSTQFGEDTKKINIKNEEDNIA
ncbi:hypothetical protein DICVIV_00773 [Dictyocaulus viviparus]|uniref:Uncharacterized protein n=1 Tax=Dictyocaulus viviparus TaxID=29172 RepID=A0A0D8Y8A4_DICVI|nr:hypothetical protein DICVIV_00773 [Dictyocaulus viviparus]